MSRPASRQLFYTVYNSSQLLLLLLCCCCYGGVATRGLTFCLWACKCSPPSPMLQANTGMSPGIIWLNWRSSTLIGRMQSADRFWTESIKVSYIIGLSLLVFCGQFQICPQPIETAFLEVLFARCGSFSGTTLSSKPPLPFFCKASDLLCSLIFL